MPDQQIKISDRIRDAAKLAGGFSALAQKSQIPLASLNGYLAGIKLPTERFIAIAKAADVSLDWLAPGEPPVHTARRLGEFIEDTGRSASVPVIGLAECGLKGWYQESTLAISATRPGDLFDPEAFAVIAIGASMRPAGILEGFLCFCSPRTAADKGDRVYIERRDGTASIKEYVKRDETWLHLQGWLDPDESGRQEPYGDQVKLDQVGRLATVVYIKLKL